MEKRQRTERPSDPAAVIGDARPVAALGRTLCTRTDPRIPVWTMLFLAGERNDRGESVANEPAQPAAEAADPERQFDALLAKFSDSRDVAERARIDDEIWQTFGTEGSVFISDMSGFSRTTRALGICHFLAQIYRVRPIVARAVGDNGGILLKAETDNCYAYFPEVDQAVKAAVEINRELDRQNQSREGADKAYVSIGIDWGRMLLIGEVEFFGDPINTASKLGEDLAARCEILVTRRAMDRVTIELDREPDQRRERISGIDIDFVCLDMAIRNR